MEVKDAISLMNMFGMFIKEIAYLHEKEIDRPDPR
ncbi:putative holin-like toxin [Paenibacillus polymyxa]|nr:putative holin-like toxin [Paenibacillus polymyxa]MDY8025911.1 putative holin-like toxin [Paenibacillus polymyxa]